MHFPKIPMQWTDQTFTTIYVSLPIKINLWTFSCYIATFYHPFLQFQTAWVMAAIRDELVYGTI